MPYAYAGDNCYGRGDYYRGDYYRGDPGIFGSIGKFLGGAIKTVAKATPIGQAISTGLSIAKALSGPKPPGNALIHPPTFAPPLMVGGGFVQEPGQLPSQLAIRARYQCAPPGMKGLTWNKSTYITRGGGTSRWPQALLVHPKGTECVKTRRMNVGNARALRRSIRRTRGFVKLARRAAGAVGFKVVSKGYGRKGKK